MSRSVLKRLLGDAPQVSPFLVLGDPTPELSVELAKTSVACGAGMIELGFPYGDPVADGPAIQRADMRALENGTSTSKAMVILGRIRDACPKTPLNLLVYANLVHARGFDRFCEEAADAGASSLLVPDVCLEESVALKKACRKAGLGHVQLIGPLTPSERLKRIDAAATSFIYLVAHQGVTGVRGGGFDEVEALVGSIAWQLRNPLCVGFGLSTPEQIRRVLAAGARLAVVGSYLADVIGASESVAGSSGRGERLLAAFSQALVPLVAAAV
ncbi:MAG: tryptophan synthase subunit alpha [Acidobacteriota bacterium]|nr:MAG: tryptophan synthase subunit alpha [Acidobacteriota bacterium]